MQWTEEGYMDYAGPSNVSGSVFSGFSRAGKDVKPDIREKIEGIINSPGLEEALDWIEVGTLRATVSKPAAQALDYMDCGWFRESLKKLPKTRHDEFYEGLTFVAHYEHLMEDIIPRWTEEDWTEASQEDIYDMYGTYKLDVSKITLSPSHCIRSYVHVGKIQAKHNETPLIECGYSRLDFEFEDLTDEELVAKLKARDAMRGWDVVRLLKKKKDKRDEERKAEYRDEREKRGEKERPSIPGEGDFRNPYCRMTNFPDNAHESYIRGCIDYCGRIVGDDSWSSVDQESAKKIASGLKERFKV